MKTPHYSQFKIINKTKKHRYLLLLMLFSCNIIVAQSSCVGGGNQNGILGGGGLDSLLNKIKTLFDWFIEEIRPGDPNQITGNKGLTVKQWVSIHDQLNYTIEFENDPAIASGDAQNVYIHFAVPSNSHINLNSLHIGSFGFGNFNFDVPNSSATYSKRLDLRDSLKVYVDVTAGIDIINHEFFWQFRSVDPLTGQTPTDGRGFLHVSDTSATALAAGTTQGRGFVSFYASPLSTLKTLDTVAAQASIVFDLNDPVPTNVWVNTIDAVAPTSLVNRLDTAGNTITLHWQGQDDPGGSGVASYDVYVSENGAPFTAFKSNIDSTIASFTGTPGNNYSFFTLATDTTGNKETLKTKGDKSITLNETILPVKWLYFTAKKQDNDALLTWATISETNSKLFDVERSLNGIDFTDIGTVMAAGNSTQVNNYQYVDLGAMLLQTNALYYRLRQIDKDGGFIYSSIVLIPVTNNVSAPIVKAYPNPFKERIILQIITISSTDKTNHVRITSLDGRTVYDRKLDYTGSSTILLENLPLLSNGTYILNVSVNGKLYNVKMLKQ